MEANMRAACNCDGRGQTARRIFRLQAASPSFPMATTMRLVSFNILEGFRPLAASSAERRLMDRDRAEAARTVVAELSPDILVLNEALFCRQHAGREVDYAALFGFRCAAVALYEEEWGNAILSRFPIVASSEMRIYNRGGLLATIETPDGALQVASYHPHPRRQPQNKALDFARLVEGFTGPALVCGDFNCINPEDEVDRGRLIAAFRSFSAEPERDVDQFIESGKQVFTMLGRLGFQDAVPQSGRRYSIPTDFINRDKSSGMRIDHILCNAAVNVVGGEVVQRFWTERASDHHPVMVDFRLLAPSKGLA
jgi:endonuclease/exonuclease/phosphatase family metal-dependent hydrolase